MQLGMEQKKVPSRTRPVGKGIPTNHNNFKPTIRDIVLGSGTSSVNQLGASKPMTSTKPKTGTTGTKDTTSEYIYTRKNGNGDVSSTPTGGEQFWNKVNNPNYVAPVNNSSELDSYTTNQAYADSKSAMEEAKTKTEASKVSALGYFKGVEDSANDLYDTDLISSDQEQQALNLKKNQLAVNSQNLTGAFGDADSGIQAGTRQNIAMNTANMASNLPIQTRLDIATQNRAAKVEALGQRYNVAGAKANIETAYDYDPGIDYIAQLGEALGSESTGSGASTTTSTQTAAEKKAKADKAYKDFMLKRKNGYTDNMGVHVDTSGTGYSFNYSA